MRRAWTQAFPRSKDRPPGEYAAPNSKLTRPSLSAPRRKRRVDLSQNGYSLSLSLSFFFREGRGTVEEEGEGATLFPGASRPPKLLGEAR